MFAKSLLSVALLAAAASASAVTVTSFAGAPDPGPLAGQTIVVDFDNPNAAGYVWSGGLFTASTSVGGAHAQPAGNSDVFGYVSSAKSPNTATLKTPDLRSISFYWGSIDTYNEVKVLGAGGTVLLTIGGGSLPPATGNQGAPQTNRRVNFEAAKGEVITGLTVTSTGVAFEFDDFATSAVPEPATWAMLIAGFGLVGAAARRRRSVATVRA